MTLTSEQHARLERMPDEAKIIGRDNGDPVVTFAGRMLRVDPTGRTRELSMRSRIEISRRRIERAEL